MNLPTRGWCYNKLSNNRVGELNRRKWKIVAAYIVGSVARGTARPDSDLDIAVVIEMRNGKPPRLSALKETDLYHSNFRSNSQKATWEGRVVDFQFFYADDPELAGYSKIELTNSRGN